APAARAAAAGRGVPRRRESQEACFLAGGDYRDFLARHGGLAPANGPVIDEDGRGLGRHQGIWRFTRGQRRGLGGGGGRPLYALGGDAATNTLVVGPREALAV